MLGICYIELPFYQNLILSTMLCVGSTEMWQITKERIYIYVGESMWALYIIPTLNSMRTYIHLIYVSIYTYPHDN